MKIKNVMDIPLWVPPEIKAPKWSAEQIKETPALGASMDAVHGQLQPGEEVEAPDAAVMAFKDRAGWRVKVR